MRAIGSNTAANAVTMRSGCSALSVRSAASIIVAGSAYTFATPRSTWRIAAMMTAASSPLPETSPIESTTRPSGRRTASYQSPPICVSFCAATYTESKRSPGTTGSEIGSAAR